MRWFLASFNPDIPAREISFPFTVGRGVCNLRLTDLTVSRTQFTLEEREGLLFLTNGSMSNPTIVDGKETIGSEALSSDSVHRIAAGSAVMLVSADPDALLRECARVSSEGPGTTGETMYFFQNDGEDVCGPMTLSQLGDAYEQGSFRKSSRVWERGHEMSPMRASDLIEFPDDDPAPAPMAAGGFDALAPSSNRFVSSEEREPEPGVSFMCPYCRTVSDLEDVLSVSTSPSLLGDPVLGPYEQVRFLPSRFTANGMALDSDGGVCTEIACPRCHMSLPSALLQTSQMVMSVVGAAGAGKSVFLASAIWQCRQILRRKFGVTFRDLDPVANRWINDYEEKLFFQEDADSLQKIDKTDVNSSVVSRQVRLNGADVLLPLPSFFQIRFKDEVEQSLVVYDSAGEHFRAGADTSSSLVTLNMLGADVLFFLFDPSADPRFAPFLDRGKGTAKNHAQRQDTLLSEMAARIRRHLGFRGESRLSRPLLFGISKSDMLRDELPLDAELYRPMGDGSFALDFGELRAVSRRTESFMDEIAPEVVATAHDIAEEVWFVPFSALGHNPMQEGVRPADVKPVYSELPVVFTLARKDLLPSVGDLA